MKEEISSVELRYILDELKFLIDGKLDQIYQPKKNILLLQFYVPNKGKQILRVMPGKFLFLTKYKEKTIVPFDYCIYLRKYLANARLLDIKQIGSERIVDFLFQTKENILRLVVELFGKGNIVLCTENYTILSPLETQKWKDRFIAPKKSYTYPKKKYNLFELKSEELKNILQKSKQESLVKALALDLGFGGIYSEEICILSDIDKNSNPRTLGKKEINSLFNEIKKLGNKKIRARALYKNSKVIDITPFELKIYGSLEKKEFKIYNEALDSIITDELREKEGEELEKIKNKAILKIEKLVEIQEKQAEMLKESADDNQKKGELIYENYQPIQKILAEAKELKKKYPWHEIKKKLKKHVIFRDIKEKEGKIILEIQK